MFQNQKLIMNKRDYSLIDERILADLFKANFNNLHLLVDSRLIKPLLIKKPH